MNEPKAHLFICVNDRGEGAKESCAQKGAQGLRDAVKKLCKERNLQGVRINNAGCLGPCEQGISTVLYPQGKWTLNVKADEASKLADLVEEALKKP